MKMYFIAGALLVLVITVAVISIKLNILQKKKNAELKDELKRKEKIEKQKEKINTHDNSANFGNSINILSDFSKRKH